MRICSTGGHRLADRPTGHQAQEVPGVLPPAPALPAHPLAQPRLQVLVQHEVKHRLRGAVEGGAEAQVEAPQAPLPPYLPDDGGPAGGGDLPVQLQPGLHHPDGVGGDAGDHAGRGCGLDVDSRSVPAGERGGAVEAGLACGVGPEVDGPGGGHTHQVGAETPEQAPHPLLDQDMSEAVEDAGSVEQDPLAWSGGEWRPGLEARTGGLQAGLDHLESCVLGVQTGVCSKITKKGFSSHGHFLDATL